MRRPGVRTVTSERGVATPRPFLRLFVSPAVLCALGFVAALAAVMQYSLRAYVPGSLEPGGFTLANFAALGKPHRVHTDHFIIVIEPREQLFNREPVQAIQRIKRMHPSERGCGTSCKRTWAETERLTSVRSSHRSDLQIARRR